MAMCGYRNPVTGEGVEAHLRDIVREAAAALLLLVIVLLPSVKNKRQEAFVDD